jgi:phosphonate transport system ATP-binding protein
MEALKRINDEDGITVVVSLHQVEYARYFCRRAIALENGRIAFDGPSRALSDERLRQIYGAASDELILPHEEPPTRSEPTPITPAYAFS